MPRYVIPPSSGPFEVLRARAGNALVANSYSGKRKVRIPCRSKQQAEELCRQLNEGRHKGEVFVLLWTTRLSLWAYRGWELRACPADAQLVNQPDGRRHAAFGPNFILPLRRPAVSGRLA